MVKGFSAHICAEHNTNKTEIFRKNKSIIQKLK